MQRNCCVVGCPLPVPGRRGCGVHQEAWTRGRTAFWSLAWIVIGYLVAGVGIAVVIMMVVAR
jgi:hypothetical protein